VKDGDDNFIIMGPEKLNNFEENTNGKFYLVWVVMSQVKVHKTRSLLNVRKTV
jgi:hypothetical protein